MIKKNFECNYIQHNWGYCPDEIYSNYSELQNFNDTGNSLCLLENEMLFAGAMAGAVVFRGSCTELQPFPKALEKIWERGFATASIVLYTQNWVVFLIQLILLLPQNCLRDN